jgi:hypothetical protein
MENSHFQTITAVFAFLCLSAPKSDISNEFFAIKKEFKEINRQFPDHKSGYSV